MLKHAKPDAVKIGVCFPFQIVEEIALESHDVLMDMVVG
jgi:5-formyltetrahydrofolate cyclo-ligase